MVYYFRRMTKDKEYIIMKAFTSSKNMPVKSIGSSKGKKTNQNSRVPVHTPPVKKDGNNSGTAKKENSPKQ